MSAKRTPHIRQRRIGNMVVPCRKLSDLQPGTPVIIQLQRLAMATLVAKAHGRSAGNGTPISPFFGTIGTSGEGKAAGRALRLQKRLISGAAPADTAPPESLFTPAHGIVTVGP